MVPRVLVDTELSFTEISEEFFNVMNQFQPYGPENMTPIFVTKGVFDSGTGRMVGANGEHLKLDLCHESTGTKTIPAIAFGQANHNEYIRKGNPFDICYSVEMNEFRGNRNLQLNIRDIKTPEN
jgi:single-stranded-DNA-specific exonuclease